MDFKSSHEDDYLSSGRRRVIFTSPEQKALAILPTRIEKTRRKRQAGSSPKYFPTMSDGTATAKPSRITSEVNRKGLCFRSVIAFPPNPAKSELKPIAGDPVIRRTMNTVFIFGHVLRRDKVFSTDRSRTSGCAADRFPSQTAPFLSLSAASLSF